MHCTVCGSVMHLDVDKFMTVIINVLVFNDAGYLLPCNVIYIIGNKNIHENVWTLDTDSNSGNNVEPCMHRDVVPHSWVGFVAVKTFKRRQVVVDPNNLHVTLPFNLQGYVVIWISYRQLTL